MFNDIIKQAQKILACPVCKKHFNKTDIKLRATLDNTFIFQTICNNHKNPVVTVFIATFGNNNQPKLNLNNINFKPITSNDLIEYHKQINNFDGDFIKLWKKSL